MCLCSVFVFTYACVSAFSLLNTAPPSLFISLRLREWKHPERLKSAVVYHSSHMHEGLKMGAKYEGNFDITEFCIHLCLVCGWHRCVCMCVPSLVHVLTVSWSREAVCDSLKCYFVCVRVPLELTCNQGYHEILLYLWSKEQLAELTPCVWVGSWTTCVSSDENVNHEWKLELFPFGFEL